ncbi:MAG TPA: hypothetical protein VGD95_07205 [Micavibrio sp.]
MIEGVNSSLQTAQLLRANVQQTAETAAFSADTAPVQKLARAPSMSIYVDIDFDTAVLQFKNAETRAVIDQIPSETLLQSRARDEARQAAVREQIAKPLSEARSSETRSSESAPTTSTPDVKVGGMNTDKAPAAPVTTAPTPQQMAAFASAASAATSGTPQTSVSVLA